MSTSSDHTSVAQETDDSPSSSRSTTPTPPGAFHQPKSGKELETAQPSSTPSNFSASTSPSPNPTQASSQEAISTETHDRTRLAGRPGSLAGGTGMISPGMLNTLSGLGGLGGGSGPFGDVALDLGYIQWKAQQEGLNLKRKGADVDTPSPLKRKGVVVDVDTPPSSGSSKSAGSRPMEGSSRGAQSASRLQKARDPNASPSSHLPLAGMGSMSALEMKMLESMGLGGGLGSLSDLGMMSDSDSEGMFDPLELEGDDILDDLALMDGYKMELEEAMKNADMMLEMLDEMAGEEEADGVFIRTSHPPRSSHGSAGADLAYYFTSSDWDLPWFQSASYEPEGRTLPVDNDQMILAKSWKVSGTQKHVYIGALFSDLSLCWGHVEFIAKHDYSQSEAISDEVQKDARYIPSPEPMDEASLIHASQTYGPIIMAFAVLILQSRQAFSLDRDLVSEAFKYAEDCEDVPRLVPPVHGTYGHLIFEGKAYSKEDVRGRWRGGDSMVRRGDILRWKKAKVNVLGNRPGTAFCVGNLNHTGIIVKVEDSSLEARKLKDGEPVSLKDLGKFFLAERPENEYKGPQLHLYDMASFQEGEVWIYRPVGMKAYLGIDSLRSRAPSEEEGVKTCEWDRKGKGVAK